MPYRRRRGYELVLPRPERAGDRAAPECPAYPASIQTELGRPQDDSLEAIAEVDAGEGRALDDARDKGAGPDYEAIGPDADASF